MLHPLALRFDAFRTKRRFQAKPTVDLHGVRRQRHPRADAGADSLGLFEDDNLMTVLRQDESRRQSANAASGDYDSLRCHVFEVSCAALTLPFQSPSLRLVRPNEASNLIRVGLTPDI
jgi:hypothetical protein